jgi:hypothetical protein
MITSRQYLSMKVVVEKSISYYFFFFFFFFDICFIRDKSKMYSAIELVIFPPFFINNKLTGSASFDGDDILSLLPSRRRRVKAFGRGVLLRRACARIRAMPARRNADGSYVVYDCPSKSPRPF